MKEIKDALAAGKEVVTHTDAVSVPGWSGAGYIIYDPQTGDGAYKIAGGENGGWLLVVAGVLLLFAAFFLPELAVFYAAETPAGLFFADLVGLFFSGISALSLGLSRITHNPKNRIRACQVAVLSIVVATFGFAGLLVPILFEATAADAAMIATIITIAGFATDLFLQFSEVPICD